MNPELERKLRALRLSGMATALAARNQEAIHHHFAYTDFLELLVEDELAKRRDRLFARRLKQSHIPGVKDLESFDWSFNPRLPKPLILDLATARFVAEHAGVLLLGPPARRISRCPWQWRPSRRGYTVLYISAFDLAQDMTEALATGVRRELVRLDANRPARA